MGTEKITDGQKVGNAVNQRLIAVLLHLSKRLKYLRQNWHDDWNDGAIDKARQVWGQYKDLFVASAPEEAPEIQMPVYGKLTQSLDVKETYNCKDKLEKFINGSLSKIAYSPLT